MKDYLVSAITSDGAIRVIVANSTKTVDRAREIHQMSPTACAALGRTLTAAAIMGSMLKGADDSITLQLQGGGPIGRVMAVSDAKATVKGYVDHPQITLPLNKKGKLDVGGAVGRSGNLSVVRDFGLKEPYVGQVPLVNGEVAEDLTFYYAHSEQLPTAVALGVLVDVDYSVKAAGGFILQLLPGATEEDTARMERVIAELPAVTQLISDGQSPEGIVETLLSGYEVEYFESMDLNYQCDCSRDRIDRALISLGKTELSQMIEEDGKAEVSCHFCDRLYQYTKDELEDLLRTAKEKTERKS